MRGNVLNVFPTSSLNDPEYVLNWKVLFFKAKNEDRFRIFFRLQDELHRLYPNKFSLTRGPLYRMATGKSLNGKDKTLIPMSFEMRNVTVREILNMISFKENSCWNAVHAVDFETFLPDPNFIIKFSSEYESSFYANPDNYPNWITGKINGWPKDDIREGDKDFKKKNNNKQKK